MIDICYNNCFLADNKSAFNSATIPPQTAPFFEHKLFCTLRSANPSIKTRLNNGEKMYKDKHTVALLAQFIAKYSSILESESFVQIAPERWIKLALKAG